jgi:hypothetical protein
MDSYFPLGSHAVLRTAHRDISVGAIEFVLLYGDWYWHPGPRGGPERCEVTLSRRHIPQDEWAAFGYLAGTIVIIEDPRKVITVMKKRCKETDLHSPYVRQRIHWRRYMDDDLLS